MTAPQDPYAVGTTPGSERAVSGPLGQQTAGQGLPQPRRRNGVGTAALVIGILAVITSWTVVGGAVLGVGAIVLGALGRGRAARGEADNRGIATAGLVLGVIGLLSAALIAFGVSLLNSPKGQQLQDCLKTANGNTAAVQQCQTQYVGR